MKTPPGGALTSKISMVEESVELSEDFVPIFGGDKPRERHFVHKSDVIFLIGLPVGVDSALAFESCPFVAVKDEQIGEALPVELKGKTAGQPCFENINQPVLKTAFET